VLSFSRQTRFDALFSYELVKVKGFDILHTAGNSNSSGLVYNSKWRTDQH